MADPFWLLRARKQLNNPAINEAYLTHEDGYPQTIYSQSHPIRLKDNPHADRVDPERETILYPSIRFRGPDDQFGPGLQRLSEYQAREEAMRLRDYLVFQNARMAEDYARNLSNSIRRKPNS